MQINRPPGFRQRRASLNVSRSEALVGRCSKKLLVKTTSRVSSGNGQRVAQSCFRKVTSAGSRRSDSGFRSMPYLTRARMFRTNSPHPQPRSSTTLSTGT
jgi:hypothetical protein